MKSLNKFIVNSGSADLVNSVPYNYDFRWKLTPEEYLRFWDLVFPYDRFVEGNRDMSKEDLTEMLWLGCKAQSLMCHGLAMVLAIKLREDTSLPEELRNSVHVCEVGGHVMCCVGDPESDNSIIIDPWIKYLNLDGHEHWRPGMVMSASHNRERGFMGSVAQYRKFLTDHPNEYVSADTPKDVLIAERFSEKSKGISTHSLELN